MKKSVSLILALVLICTTLFSLTSCGDPDVNVDELNAQIADLNKQINEANSKISILEAEKATQTTEITNLKADIKVLEAEKATLDANKVTLDAEKALLEEEVADLEAEIARLQALMDGNSNQLLEEIAELEAQIDSLEAEVSTLNSAKANLESEILTLNAQISSLNADKATLTARITELEASVAAKNTEIADLNSTVSALTTQKTALATENSELKEENEELKALVEALRNCLKDIHTYADGFCTTCGKEDKSAPAYTRDGDYIYFGEYPQTIKADDVTITSTTDDRGYYLGSDSFYYAKVVADPYSSGYTFSTGATVIDGKVYYFKVEPIRWRILREENGKAFLLCDSIVDSRAFDDDSNDYADSTIRVWLNSTFYKTAFSELASSLILTTEVDNSLASTTDAGNLFICENTNDKVFLLSRADATNNTYGFSSDQNLVTNTRAMLTSDYSRAVGTSMKPSGNGTWWLRSPSTKYDDYAHLVNHDGGIRGIDIVYESDYGIVPALWITL